jgi:hypothetical protein
MLFYGLFNASTRYFDYAVYVTEFLTCISRNLFRVNLAILDKFAYRPMPVCDMYLSRIDFLMSSASVLRYPFRVITYPIHVMTIGMKCILDSFRHTYF